MTKQYPRPNNTNFILCDDVRTEAGNKLSFLGVFSGGNIIINRMPGAATSDNFVLESLSFFIDFICDTTDLYALTIEVLDPSEKTVLRHTGNIQRKEKDRKLSIIFKMLQFKVKEFGKYKVVVRFDDRAFSYDFEILLAAGD